MRKWAVIRFRNSRLASKNSATARDLVIDEVSTIIDCQFFSTRYCPLAYDHNGNEDSEQRQQRRYSCIYLVDESGYGRLRMANLCTAMCGSGIILARQPTVRWRSLQGQIEGVIPFSSISGLKHRGLS